MKTSLKPIICCGFTPCVQRIIEFENVRKNGVNRASKVTIGIGGKGANTARMVTQLGADAELVEFSGGANGRHLERMLDAEGVGWRHIEVAGETRICQTLVEKGNPETTELVEEMPAITESDWSNMMALIESLGLKGAVVALSGKAPAGAPADAYARLCKLVLEQGGRVILDTQGEPLLSSLKHQPLMVKINDEELRLATGIDDVQAACNEILARGAQSVLITAGSQRAFFTDGTMALDITPPRIQAVNPVGSGDAVTAGLAVSLNAGASMEDALVHAMACGAANALNLLSGYLIPTDVDRLRSSVLVTSL